MEEKLKRVSTLQSGRLVQLSFPTSPRCIYLFATKEHAAYFIMKCDQLEKFMEGIVPEDRFDVSFKQLMMLFIAEFHIPVLSVKEEFTPMKKEERFIFSRLNFFR